MLATAICKQRDIKSLKGFGDTSSSSSSSDPIDSPLVTWPAER